MTDKTCMDVACPGKTRCSDPDCSPARADATYTAAEVRVLTEAALRLGRKEAGEEIAEALQAYVENYPEDVFPPDGTTSDSIAAKAMRHAYPNAARIALEISAQAPDATSDATSGVPGHQEVSEAVRSPQAGGDHCLDLDRLMGIKWGDKVIDPREVAYILRGDE